MLPKNLNKVSFARCTTFLFINHDLLSASCQGHSHAFRLLDSYSSEEMGYQSLILLDFSILRTKVIDFLGVVSNKMNNLTISQEVKTAKESNKGQLSKVNAFCSICRKSVCEAEHFNHKKIHLISKFQQKYNNRKSYLNSYLDRLNLPAQLKLNQFIRPMLRIPKVNQQEASIQKSDYLGRAILNTHLKLVSESYW